MASKFKGASTAKVSEKGQKFSNGKHLCKIKRLSYSDDGKNGEYYVVELEVVKSDSAKDVTGKQIDPPGAERVWTQSMEKKVFPLPKLNAFAYAAMGYDIKNPADAAYLQENITPNMDDILDSTQDETDPLGFKGRLVWVTSNVIDSKNKDSSGVPFKFVACTFAPGQPEKLLGPETAAAA